MKYHKQLPHHPELETLSIASADGNAACTLALLLRASHKQTHAPIGQEQAERWRDSLHHTLHLEDAVMMTYDTAQFHLSAHLEKAQIPAVLRGLATDGLLPEPTAHDMITELGMHAPRASRELEPT